MQKLILILSITLLLTQTNHFIHAKKDTSTVKVDFNYPAIGEISPLHFGAFFEYVENAMLGTTGLLAQEILDRGFDSPPCRQGGISCNWYHYFTNTAGKWSLLPGGINTNGEYFQRIENVEGDGEVGVYQTIYLPEEGSDFHIYFKGIKSSGELSLSFMDTTFKNTIYSISLGYPNEKWKKVELEIPANLNAKKCCIVLSIKNKGYIDLDEASLVSKNHKFQMRDEIYELFSEWAPPIIRYPGGCFADEHPAHWEYGIGDLTQRKSSNPYDAKTQRLEFGTDEFIAFCKSINSEPHLVVNFANGTSEEAANWVEYCNGDTNTHFGRLRAINGHIEKYNVKYWEIGNEQWDNPGEYSRGLIDFVKEMKKKDPSIVIICDGNIWGGMPFFDTLIDIAGDYIDIYGWHYVHSVWDKGNNPEDVYLSIIAGPKDCQKSVIDIEQWIKKRKPRLNLKQGLTELWTAFDDFNWMHHDRLNALETALWSALQLFLGFKHSESYIMNQRTCNSGVFVKGYNKSGFRKFIPSPSFYAMSVLQKHTGKYSHFTETICKTFDVPKAEGLWVDVDIPWLDAVTSSTLDSVFIAIVNRNMTDSNLIYFDLKNINYDSIASVVELSGQHFLDMNTPDEPGNVIPSFRKVSFNKEFTVPPLSLTILSIPIKDTNQLVNPNDIMFEANPNPFSYVINFKMILKKEDTYNLSIFNSIGEQVFSEIIRGDTRFYNLNTGQLAKGFYLATLRSKNNTKTIKLFKD